MDASRSNNSQRILLLILGLIGAVGVFLYAWLQDSGNDPPQDLFRDQAAPIALLDPWLLADDGNRTPATTPLPASGTLIFQLRISRPGPIALLRRQGPQPPQLLLQRTDLRPGIPQFLSTKEGLLREHYQDGLGALQYCVITATGTDELQQRIDNAARHWQDLSWRACTRFESAQTATNTP